MQDNILISRAKHGDQEALEELIRRWYQPIYKYLVRKTGNTSIASDLTQETFLKFVESLPRYSPLAAFSTYIHTIAYHVSVDYFRKHKDYQVYDDKQWDMLEDKRNGVDDNYYRMKEILYKLPDKQRECIILYYYQGLKYRQIAEVLSIPVSTAKTRVRTGLQACRKLWEVEE